MNLQEIKQKLAEMMYHSSPVKEGETKVAFEDLEDAQRKPFLELSQSVLVAVDKMGLVVGPRPPVIKDPHLVDVKLKNHIETVVRDFFKGIKIFKKGAIPQEELVAQMFNMFKSL